MVTSILPLNLKDAIVRKRGKVLVGPIDLELDGTGVTMIMGPNGSGKTTLLKLMHGLERPREGSVSWCTDMAYARQKQAFVFQTPTMLRRTALANIAYPLFLEKRDRKEALSIALDWLQRIGLKQAENLDAKFLSGGERQKLALARALVIEPEVLFLDEPTANLDGQSTREIEALIKEAVASGVRVIMTTHDIGQGKRLAQDAMFIYRGKVHEHKSATDFFESPSTTEAKAFLEGEIVV